MDEQQKMARMVLGHYGLPGGWEPGGFTSKLITAWVGADHHNKTKLASAFPELARAMNALDHSTEKLELLAWPDGAMPDDAA